MKVILLPQAREELDKISDPIFSRILRRLRLLGQFPEMGAPMAGPFAGYRSTVVGQFRAVYRILPDGDVEIAYVHDCRRAPPA